MLFSSGIGKAPEVSLKAAGIIPIVKKGNIEELILEYAKYQRYMQPQVSGGSKPLASF
ncbi:hypothetical protein D1872_329200 [compost metagenome]